EKLKARPEECVMVGDSVNDDMLPARKLGMKTVLIKRNIRIYFEPKKYEPVITDLNQLEQYLYS
ncbi:MAG: haloacid dehalogenase, partial [Candidatus Aenigmatarchaeota archaeon]